MPYIQYSDEKLKQKALKENRRGQGTPESPYIIDSPNTFFDESIIKDSSLHIIIKNNMFKYMTLKCCQNIRFEDCTFDVLQLLKCSNMSIDNCFFKMRFRHNKKQ